MSKELRQTYVTFRGAIETAQIRTATYYDVDHLVLPVIALLGDVVVKPMNSFGPEFVPAEVLAVAPGGWGGRPVVGVHPEQGTASANEPRTLEAMAFGVVFNPRFEEGKLKVEAWLDPERATLLGGEALRVFEAAQAALDGEDVEPIEVSIGAWVSLEEVSGKAPSGEVFEFRWKAIVPDHLAVGLNGSQGACSVDMGCGAPRANARKPEHTQAQMRAANGEDGMAKKKPNILQRMIDKFRVHQEDGVSDTELRNELWDAVRNVEPGFEWIESVFPETGRVVYAVSRDDAFMLFRRSFEVDDEGEVTLADDAEEVEQTVEFTPVSASADDESNNHTAATGSADCSCGGSQPTAAQDNNQGDSPMSEKLKKLVDGLIACEASPFAEDDRERLSTFNEPALEAMAAKFAAAEGDEDGATEGGEETAPAEGEEEEEETAEAAAAAPTAEPAGDAVTLSREQFDDVMASANAHKAHVASQKKVLVARLVAAQKTYTQVELQAMSLESLEKTARLLRAATPENPTGGPDYIGRGMSESDAQPSSAVAPLPYTLALEKQKGTQN